MAVVDASGRSNVAPSGSVFVGRKPSDVLYFAYGSNMEPEVFEKRRGIKPMLSVPGVVDGYVLSFRLLGIPYLEPGFATIERCAQKTHMRSCCVHAKALGLMLPILIA